MGVGKQPTVLFGWHCVVSVQVLGADVVISCRCSRWGRRGVSSHPFYTIRAKQTKQNMCWNKKTSINSIYTDVAPNNQSMHDITHKRMCALLEKERKDYKVWLSCSSVSMRQRLKLVNSNAFIAHLNQWFLRPFFASSSCVHFKYFESSTLYCRQSGALNLSPSRQIIPWSFGHGFHAFSLSHDIALQK